MHKFCMHCKILYHVTQHLFVKVKVTQCVRLFATPWTVQSMEFSRPEYQSGQPFPSSGELPKPGIELNPGLLHCRWILYQLRHKRSPQNTGVGSLSLLQWIFLTQESNQDLLHCRWILYQLSYQGNEHIDGTF